MIETGKIQALITLLGDDDQRVREIARERLLHIGEAATEFLHEAGRADLEGKIRIEARHVLAKIREEDLIASFYLLSLLEDEQIDLEHAVFLLARFGYPELEIEPYRRELDQLAKGIGERITGLDSHRDSREIVRLMNLALFEDEGFTGNFEDYYDPDNSYLNCVLERRTGIPVTISAIYLLLARRLNLPIRGINMPIHFICQYHSSIDSFYIDPFNKGQMLTAGDCMRLLHRAKHPFHESYLAPARPRDIIVRMIRNLLFIYHQRDEQAKIDVLNRIVKILLT